MARKINKTICDLIKKVLEISKFKREFKQNRQRFFTSGKAFVTFKSHRDVWAFQQIYSSTYQCRLRNLFCKKASLTLNSSEMSVLKKVADEDTLDEVSSLIRLDSKEDGINGLKNAPQISESGIYSPGAGKHSPVLTRSPNSEAIRWGLGPVESVLVSPNQSGEKTQNGTLSQVLRGPAASSAVDQPGESQLEIQSQFEDFEDAGDDLRFHFILCVSVRLLLPQLQVLLP